MIHLYHPLCRLPNLLENPEKFMFMPVFFSGGGFAALAFASA